MPNITTSIIARSQRESQNTLASVDEQNKRGPSRKTRVLIIDDEPNVAFVLQCILASLPNISAVSFLNPFEVLEATAKEAFDLIITDYSMPEMDGITLARQLHAQHPATKIVMLTAYGTTPETSADDVLNATLSKPIASQTLRRFVTDLLGNAPLQPSHINH